MHREFSFALALALLAGAAGPLLAQATGLSATKATSSEIDLSWSGSASSYTVQRRSLGGSFTTINTVSTKTIADSQIDAYTTYQYQILASGSNTPSNIITVGPPPSGFSLVAAAPLIGGDPVLSYGHDIALAEDANGDPAFAFVFDDPNQDNNHTDTQLLFRSWNRAAYSWNPVVTVATVGDIATTDRNTASLAFDSTMGVYVLASEFQSSAGDSAIKLYTSSDGGKTWTTKQTYSSDATYYGPSVALSGSKIYLAFNVDTIGIEYYTGAFSSDPSTWTTKTAPVPLGTDVAQFGTGPSLALDGSGTPGIAYWASDTNQSYNEVLFFWRPAGSTLPVRVTDTQNNQSGVNEVLHFTGNNPRILFYGQRNDAGFGVGNHFVISNDGGSTWQTPVVIPPDGDSSTDSPFDMALDSKGNAAVAFGQNSNSGDSVCGNPKLSRSSDYTHWTTCAAADVSVTSGFDVYPASIAVAFGGNDKLFMVWKDTADDGNGVGVFLWREPPAGAPTGPNITEGGVVSNATGLAGIVSGSWATIYGANFSDIPMDWSNADFSLGILPTTLNGIQVMMNNLPAAIYFVNATQINVQVPAGLNGAVNVQVIKNGQPSNTVTAQAVEHAPGLFTYSIDYKTFYPSARLSDYTIVGDPAVAGNSVSKACSTTAPSPPACNYVLLYATGLAPSTAGQLIHEAIPFSDSVSVKVGTASATVLGSAYLVAAGEFQINIQVPAGLPPGNYPLTLTADGVSTQTGVVLPVGPVPGP